MLRTRTTAPPSQVSTVGGDTSPIPHPMIDERTGSSWSARETISGDTKRRTELKPGGGVGRGRASEGQRISGDDDDEDDASTHIYMSGRLSGGKMEQAQRARVPDDPRHTGQVPNDGGGGGVRQVAEDGPVPQERGALHRHGRECQEEGRCRSHLAESQGRGLRSTALRAAATNANPRSGWRTGRAKTNRGVCCLSDPANVTYTAKETAAPKASRSPRTDTCWRQHAAQKSSEWQSSAALPSWSARARALGPPSRLFVLLRVQDEHAAAKERDQRARDLPSGDWLARDERVNDQHGRGHWAGGSEDGDGGGSEGARRVRGRGEWLVREGSAQIGTGRGGKNNAHESISVACGMVVVRHADTQQAKCRPSQHPQTSILPAWLRIRSRSS